MRYKASIIIPALNRHHLVDLAIASVLKQRGAESVQLIIVDDGSQPPITPTQLRSQDKVIYNHKTQGAAVSRNRGIDVAEGDLIYLLDNDDRFECRDFLVDHETYYNTKHLYYVSIRDKNFRRRYPENIEKKDFFKFIFFKHPFICQTSSLMFCTSLGLRFDESLPKHQDWDFVFSFLHAGGKVKRASGVTFFNREDKKSLSRAFNPEKSVPWLKKLKSQDGLDFGMIYYHLFSYDSNRLHWIEWMGLTSKYLLQGKTAMYFVLKSFARRVLQ